MIAAPETGYRFLGLTAAASNGSEGTASTAYIQESSDAAATTAYQTETSDPLATVAALQEKSFTDSVQGFSDKLNAGGGNDSVSFSSYSPAGGSTGNASPA